MSGGYESLSFAEVARLAGVGRQLIYHWWPTKRALVAEAMYSGTDLVLPVSYPGPFTDDLRAFLAGLVAHASRPDVRAGLWGMIVDARAEAREAPGQRFDEVEKNFEQPVRHSFAQLIAAGQARGEVRAGVDDGMVLDSIRGAVIVHSIAHGRLPAEVVSHVLEAFEPGLRA